VTAAPPTRVLVRVPASSANLGPGFDVLAAALALHVEVEVEETGRFAVYTDLPIARDRRNLCVRAFDMLADASRHEFAIRSDIPLSGGLGTSAAAIVAGLVAARHLTGSDADLLPLATELEGHPDNVAAALLGGVVVCADGGATRIDVPAGLAAVLAVPREAVRTARARAALPEAVPMADAVFNVGAASLLVLGLATGDLELVARGLGDRLHQPHRAPLYPRSMELVDRARELGALGGTISGAGPTVLLWARAEAAAEVEAAARRATEGWADVMPLAFSHAGATVQRLG
jgi:homoserine kinase